MQRKHRGNRPHKSVQIIAGEYRHRKIYFTEAQGLRPTGSRIRETLFNWLQPYLYGKTCLDLFAGSGALGFEALSRGAKHVTFVEKNRQVAQQIQNNIQQLNISNATLLNQDFTTVISNTNIAYDIIFLDPPYDLRLLPTLLEQVKTLSPSYIFIEDNRPFEKWVSEKGDYHILKSKKAGGIYYGLLTLTKA